MPPLQLNYGKGIRALDEFDNPPPPSIPLPAMGTLRSTSLYDNVPSNIISGSATIMGGSGLRLNTAAPTYHAFTALPPVLGSQRSTSPTRWANTTTTTTTIDTFTQNAPTHFNQPIYEDQEVEPSMPMPTQQFRRSEEQGDEGALSYAPPMPPFPNADEPVVPAIHDDKLASANIAINWMDFPSSVCISALLLEKGAMLPAHKSLFEYHMAQAFLESLEVLQEGSYFIYYQSKHASPKERYFRVEMGDDGTGKQVPFLNWYIHKNAVGLTDRVPLANLVGVTPTNRSSVFRQHMINAQTIVGCYSGDSKTRLPASGCFTLWFWDPYYAQPRSVDLLTTNPMVHQLWVITMRAVLSVNSVTIGSRKSELDDQLLNVQRLLDQELVEEDARLHR